MAKNSPARRPQAAATAESEKPEGFGSPEHLAELERHLQTKREGFAGVMPDGRLVDRREFPSAVPIPENAALGVPAPREWPPAETHDDASDDDDDDDDSHLVSPFVKERLRRMLVEQLALAERDERHGPGGTGWQHNESKRDETEEWAEFLRHTVKHLPS